MDTLVMKFGGSTVGTTEALTQVLSIVLHEHERWDRLVLVVSALEGVTDALIEAAHLAQMGNQRGYRRIFANLRTRHIALIEHLPLGTTERAALQADIDRQLFDVLDIFEGMSQSQNVRVIPDAVDATIGVGEKLSTRIIAALLRQNNVKSVALDTTSLIITDDVYGNATPNIPLTQTQIEANLMPLLELGIVPVVTGFIGATRSGKPTTLGRGGSDYTASVLGVTVGAKEIWIWTDVDGMMTADPREVPEARVIPTMSYEEAAEMAYFGARVLHARMTTPLQQQHIPLRVKNVFKPQQAGTLIYDVAPGRSQTIKAITSIAGLVLTAEHSTPLSPIAPLIGKTMLAMPHVRADIMLSSQSSARSFVCLLIPTSAGPDAIHSTQQALEDVLKDNPDLGIWSVSSVSIITAISTNLDQWPQTTASILQSLVHLRVLAMAQGPSGYSFSLVVDVKDSEDALHQIHELVVNSG